MTGGACMLCGWSRFPTIMENIAPLPPRWWVGGAGSQIASKHYGKYSMQVLKGLIICDASS